MYVGMGVDECVTVGFSVALAVEDGGCPGVERVVGVEVGRAVAIGLGAGAGPHAKAICRAIVSVASVTRFDRQRIVNPGQWHLCQATVHTGLRLYQGLIGLSSIF